MNGSDVLLSPGVSPWSRVTVNQTRQGKNSDPGFYPAIFVTLCVTPPPQQWVVTPGEKTKYDEMFTKTDADVDGLVSGPEVRDIFLKTGLPSTTLARIW